MTKRENDGLELGLERGLIDELLFKQRHSGCY